MKLKNNFGLWCLTINCVITKLFIDFSSFLIADTGSAAVIALIFSSLAFILLISLLYYFRYYILSCLKKIYIRNTVFVIFIGYFICGAIYFIYNFIDILGKYGYPNTPFWLLLITLAIVILIIGSMNSSAILRLNGICIPIVILGLIIISLCGIKHDDIYNMLPVFGNGVINIIGSGFKNIMAFSEIFIPILFVYLCESDSEKYNNILFSAIIGVVIYCIFSIIFLLSVPVFYNQIVDDTALFHISRFSGIGRLNTRLDVLNIIISVTSAVLYLSALILIIRKLMLKIGFKKLFKRKMIRPISVFLITTILVLPLCGCYDNIDIEDTAYVIAVGIDNNSENDNNIYTFQFTNPLSTGENMNSGEEKKEEEDKNTSVNNISVEANNIFEGIEKIKRYIGKIPSLSHMKLLVLSEDVLNNGQIIDILNSFLKIREVRPETNVCMSDSISAKDYLESVNPSLEESTARYYELLFSERSTSETMQINLRSLAIKLSDITGDGYLPMISESGFTGTVLFSKQDPKLKISTEESQVLNLIIGKLKTPIYYTAENGETYIINSSKNPKINTKISDDEIYADININKIDIKDVGMDSVQIPQDLKNKVSSVLYNIYDNRCDILEIKKYTRTKFLYQYEWDKFILNNRFDIHINII